MWHLVSVSIKLHVLISTIWLYTCNQKNYFFHIFVLDVEDEEEEYEEVEEES